MFLTILKNSLILAVGYYLSIVFLPEIMNINETVSKYVFTIPAGIWLIVSKNKWWVNVVSILLGLAISLPVVMSLSNT
ncbi:hypothetical protein [Priestia aryabhattai]